MLYWAALFFVIAVIAGLLGFGPVATAAAGIAQLLFAIFVLIFLVALALGLSRRRAPPRRREGREV
jgi:uncharacterized membrane protein YtjA (UPF0391 family)